MLDFNSLVKFYAFSWRPGFAFGHRFTWSLRLPESKITANDGSNLFAEKLQMTGRWRFFARIERLAVGALGPYYYGPGYYGYGCTQHELRTTHWRTQLARLSNRSLAQINPWSASVLS